MRLTECSRLLATVAACCLATSCSAAEPERETIRLARQLDVRLDIADPRFAGMTRDERREVANYRISFLARELLFGDQDELSYRAYPVQPNEVDITLAGGECRTEHARPLMGGRTSRGGDGNWDSAGNLRSECGPGILDQLFGEIAGPPGAVGADGYRSKATRVSGNFILGRRDSADEWDRRARVAGYVEINSGYFAGHPECDLRIRLDADNIIRNYLIIYRSDQDQVDYEIVQQFNPGWMECYFRSNLFADGMQGAASLATEYLFEVVTNGEIAPVDQIAANGTVYFYDVVSREMSFARTLAGTVMREDIAPPLGATKDEFIGHLLALRDSPGSIYMGPPPNSMFGYRAEALYGRFIVPQQLQPDGPPPPPGLR